MDFINIILTIIIFIIVIIFNGLAIIIFIKFKNNTFIITINII